MTSVAIVHYHLRRGGVTSVIKHALEACRSKGIDACVIAGEAPDDDFPAPVVVIESLGYGHGGDRLPGSEDFANEVRAGASRALGRSPDLWHIHNHSLGKNLYLPLLVAGLARLGLPVVLQPHDFAEDGRPDNYALIRHGSGRDSSAGLARFLYPQGGNVHYAVLNCRDLKFLKRAGVADEQVHLLHNAIAIGGGDAFDEPESRHKGDLIIYPTRAIRRKNVGELLLLAALDPDRHRYGVTLAPENPLEQPRYKEWVDLSRKLELPVQFEVGPNSGMPFAELLKSAKCAVTTSVAEGFGMAFLEPCLAGIPVVGRDLPEITVDFAAMGVDLSYLYESLPVPVALFDRDAFRERQYVAYRETLKAYGREPTNVCRTTLWQKTEVDGCIDFGKLDTRAQQEVLATVAGSTPKTRAIRPFPIKFDAAQAVLKGNRAAVYREFSLDRYAARLEEVYVKTLGAEAGRRPELSCERLLDCFLAPERFRPIRS